MRTNQSKCQHDYHFIINSFTSLKCLPESHGAGEVTSLLQYAVQLP